MTFISYNKKLGKILTTNPYFDADFEKPLGDMFFSFLELDFSSYNESYKILNEYFVESIRNDPDSIVETRKRLWKLNPKTTQQIKERFSQVYDITDTAEDLEFIDFLVLNQDINPDIYQHPYLLASEYFQRTPELDISIIGDYDLDELQSIFKELLEFCVNENEIYKDLSLLERYYLYLRKAGKAYITAPGMRYSPYFEYGFFTGTHLKSDSVTQQDIEYIKKYPFVGRFYVNCQTVKDFVFFEFYTIISQDIEIKKCHRCGKYFIQKGNYHTDYCDRVPEGKRHTCKKLAAIEARAEKLKSNPILKEFEKAYKRNYARRKNDIMSPAEFSEWSNKATAERDRIALEYAAEPSEQLLQQFKEFLGNK